METLKLTLLPHVIKPRGCGNAKVNGKMHFFESTDFITGCGRRMAHRKWKETKQQPGTAGPGNILGCCLVSLHFLCDVLSIRPVQCLSDIVTITL